MRLRLYLAVAPLALFVALALAAPASARTTITASLNPQHPYQQWVDDAFVPTPDLSIAVIENVAECEVWGAVACTDSRTIWLKVRRHADRRAFMHELGHIFDAEVLGEGTWGEGIRQRYLALIRQPDLPWWESEAPGAEDSPWPWWGAEWFADSYATCSVRQRFPKETIYRAANGLVGPPAMYKICRMIRGVIS